jgi:hypothetical protein
LFLNADPQMTGTQCPASVPSRSARRRSSPVISSSPRNFSVMVSSNAERTSIRFERHSSQSSTSAAGMSVTDHESPRGES